MAHARTPRDGGAGPLGRHALQSPGACNNNAHHTTQRRHTAPFHNVGNRVTHRAAEAVVGIKGGVRGTAEQGEVPCAAYSVFSWGSAKSLLGTQTTLPCVAEAGKARQGKARPGKASGPSQVTIELRHQSLFIGGFYRKLEVPRLAAQYNMLQHITTCCAMLFIGGLYRRLDRRAPTLTRTPPSALVRARDEQ